MSTREVIMIGSSTGGRVPRRDAAMVSPRCGILVPRMSSDDVRLEESWKQRLLGEFEKPYMRQLNE
jgi:hypothetical protein